MQKELIISTIPQETRVAILEDGDLVELLVERHRSQSIVGNIYKGRVTNVLPGMQSAFVNIGLERDAFLYVSDFFEDTEEYDRVVSSAEEEVAEMQEGGAQVKSTPALAAEPERKTARTSVAKQAPASREPERPGTRRREQAPASREPERPGIRRQEQAPASREPERPGIRRQEQAPASREPERPGIRRQEQAPASREPERPGIRRQEQAPASREPERPGTRRQERDKRPRKAKIPSFQRAEEPGYGGIEPLPGESLAKYSGAPPEDATARERPDLEQVIEETEERHILDQFQQEPRLPVADQEVPLDRDEAVESGRDRAVSEGAASQSETSGTTAESPGPIEEDARSEDTKGDPAEKVDAKDKRRSEHRSAQGRVVDRGENYRFTRGPAGKRPRRRMQPSGAKAEERSDGRAAAKSSPMISDLLREGQEILIQVSKEPLGKKGARITSHIALPGRYLVYMPTVDHIGVSRKIASEEERSRLKRIINQNRNGLPGGFIVRTASEGRAEEDFVRDLRFLANLWSEVRSGSEKMPAPSLIHSDLSLVERILRDQVSDDFKAIRLDNEMEYTNVLNFVNRFQPSLVNRVKLHVKDTPIFEEHGLEAELEKALRSKAWLKSGGYIVINQTEALVSIDVNTGKFVGRSNRIEDTIVRTNLDAIREIVRQIRLRNLGGIIVVDFIDMEERKSRQRVMAALEEALAADRVPSKILQFNDFGLVAITRKRTQPSLERILGMQCPRCQGNGWVKSFETACYEIQQEIRRMAPIVDGREMTVRVSPSLGKAIKSGEFVTLSDIEEVIKKDIVVKSDPLIEEDRFDIF